jgi:hypothetical protein
VLDPYLLGALNREHINDLLREAAADRLAHQAAAAPRAPRAGKLPRVRLAWPPLAKRMLAGTRTPIGTRSS